MYIYVCLTLKIYIFASLIHKMSLTSVNNILKLGNLPSLNINKLKTVSQFSMKAEAKLSIKVKNMHTSVLIKQHNFPKYKPFRLKGVLQRTKE